MARRARRIGRALPAPGPCERRHTHGEEETADAQHVADAIVPLITSPWRRSRRSRDGRLGDRRFGGRWFDGGRWHDPRGDDLDGRFPDNAVRCRTTGNGNRMRAEFGRVGHVDESFEPAIDNVRGHRIGPVREDARLVAAPVIAVNGDPRATFGGGRHVERGFAGRFWTPGRFGRRERCGCRLGRRRDRYRCAAEQPGRGHRDKDARASPLMISSPRPGYSGDPCLGVKSVQVPTCRRE